MTYIAISLMTSVSQ